MGNQFSGVTPSQIFPIETYLADYNAKTCHDAVFNCSLGSTMFLKVVKAKDKYGSIVIKIFVNHDPDLSLTDHQIQIDEVKEKLENAPNCLPFHVTEITDRACFMVRQYMNKSLYDRISTRPFLTSIEKKWIAFQLLCALNQCHQENVCHGDIKLENIMVTSWFWIVLVDFATYKPVLLPEDNPADYTYFFDSSRRRVCYIAPERFIKILQMNEEQLIQEVKAKGNELTPAMDIYSLGCVLAELFTEGVVPFDLMLLFKYRRNDYYPDKVLVKIQDFRIKAMIEGMINMDPKKRKTAAAYLQEEKEKSFPAYFYSFLWPFFKQFASDPYQRPDLRIKSVKRALPEILEALVPSDDGSTTKSESLAIIVSLIVSAVRSLKTVDSKIEALDILTALLPHTPDEVIFDRILPFIFFLLHNGEERVKVGAIDTLTYCLTLVSTIPRSDINIFPDYIFPNICDIVSDSSMLVRQTFAFHVGTISDTAMRFLEYSHRSSLASNYEKEVTGLRKFVQQKVAALFSDTSNNVKKTLLEKSVNKLSLFFDSQKANDVLLSHMITFLNEKKDSQLRLCFFKRVVGVACSIGPQCGHILQPLLLQGLNDTEESVIIAALEAMTALTQVGFFDSPILSCLLRDSVPLLAHPNPSIRHATVGLVVGVSKVLSFIAILTIVKKYTEPFLERRFVEFTDERCMLANLGPEIPREAYDAIVRCPNIGHILGLLREAAERQMPLDRLSDIRPDLDTQTRNMLRRLCSNGVDERNVSLIFQLGDHLTRVQKHKKTAEITHGDRQQVLGKLIFDGVLIRVYLPTFQFRLILSDNSLNLSSFSSSCQTVSNFPSQTMNTEWQTMFGNSPAEGKRSPTPADNRTKTSYSSSSSPTFREEGKKDYVFDCERDLEKVIAERRELYLSTLRSQRLSSSLKEKAHVPPRWRPKGNLVAHLHEHKGAVRRLVLLKSKEGHFASCSSDGSFKIWDCNKMERRFPINKSKFTYARQGGVLTSLASCQGYDTVASGSKNGSIHVVRVDKQMMTTSRQLDNKEEGHAVDMNFLETGSKSILTYGTLFGHIMGWDLRAPKLAWNLNNEIRRGLITSYAVDNSQTWMSVGTSDGYIVSWDLRFMIRVSQIYYQKNFDSGVRRIKIHPKEPSWVVSAMTGDNEVAIWDVETQTRRYTLWASEATPQFTKNPMSRAGGSGDNVVRGVADSATGLCVGQTESDGVFVITGGHDRNLRFWDLQEPDTSFRISEGEPYRKKTDSIEYRTRVVDGTEVLMEWTPPQTSNDLEDLRLEAMGHGETRTGHKAPITDVVLIPSPQRLLISSASDGTIKMWK